MIESGDNSKSILETDEADQYAWASKVTVYNASGSPQSQSGTYDDGRTWRTEWDHTESYGWVSFTDVFSKTGEHVQRYRLMDDGQHEFTIWDHANQLWSSRMWVSDKQSRVDLIETNFDDGSRRVEDLDQQGIYKWSSKVTEYNSDGLLTGSSYKYDQGAAFFSEDDLARVRSDPTSIVEIFATEKSRFVSKLSDSLSDLPDDYVALAFTALLSYELTPYGAGVWTNDLNTLLNQPTMHCRNYCDVAWQLYNLLQTPGSADVTLIGWNGGVLYSHAQLLIGIPGGPTLLVDPTIALFALTGGYNDLTAGEPIPPQHQQSFFWREDDGVGAFSETVRTALSEGALRGGDQMYWYETPLYLDRYAGTLWNPNPQRDVVIFGASSNNDFGSREFPNKKTGTEQDEILVGGPASDMIQGGAGSDIIFGGKSTFNGSNHSSHGLKLESGPFFTAAELELVLNNSDNVKSLYESRQAQFKGALGQAFAQLADDQLHLAFCAMLAHEMKQLSGDAAGKYSLAELLAASALNADETALLAWRLFQVMDPDVNANSPAGNPDVVQIGWNGSAMGRAAYLVINSENQPALLVNPAAAHFAIVDGFNQLVAGQAIDIGSQRSLLWRQEYVDLRDHITTSLHDGLYRTGNLLYWFETPDDVAFFEQSPNSQAGRYYSYELEGGPLAWATPQDGVVRSGLSAPSTIGSLASHDEIHGGRGADIIFGDGIVSNEGLWVSASASHWTIGDFDGDGRDDISRYLPGSSGADVFLSSGSRFEAAGSWTGAGFGFDGWYTGDFNGDGRDDLFRYMAERSGAEMFLSTGSRFQFVGSWADADRGVYKWFVGDFNGDGKDDIFRYLPGQSGADVFLSDGARFVHSGSWTGAGFGSDGWYIGDFNGDGRDDLLRSLSGQFGAQVFLSTGESFVNAGVWTNHESGRSGWTLQDVNGDGRMDLLGNPLGSLAGSVALISTGSGFEISAGWSPLGDSKFSWGVGDFNGDKISDSLAYSSDQAGASVFVGTGLDLVDEDRFVFGPGELQGDVIMDFQGAATIGGDTLWFRGFGSVEDLELKNVLSAAGQPTYDWVLTNLSTGVAERFTIFGVTQLGPDDYFFL